mgnify:CR=1 FL=1
MDGVIGKRDLAVLGFVQQSGIQQGMNVAMHGLDIAMHSPRRFADRHRTGAGQDLEQLPAFGGQRLPESFRSFKADAWPTGLSRLPGRHEIRQIVRQRTNINRYRVHDATGLRH